MDYFLSIAASDCSGGAGIQQDIRVANHLNYWPLTAITGITVQNHQKVFNIDAVKPHLLKEQIEKCFDSFLIRAVKVGAICSTKNLETITNCLQKYQHKTLVIDPVLFSTSGSTFLSIQKLAFLKERLFPLARIITPNKQELELLVNKKISTLTQAVEIATYKTNEWGTAILLKGGHFAQTPIQEALITANGVEYFTKDRHNFLYSHGTGCTLSTALACYLGQGKTLQQSYVLASEYLIKQYLAFNRLM